MQKRFSVKVLSFLFMAVVTGGCASLDSSVTENKTKKVSMAVGNAKGVLSGVEAYKIAVPEGAREYHVAPNAAVGGSGTAQSPLDIKTAFSGKSPVKPGDVILLHEGVYEGEEKGILRLPFEVSFSGTPTKPILIKPVSPDSVHLNGTVQINGSYVWIIGLEIGDLKWDLMEKTHRNKPVIRLKDCEGSKIINCNLFGGWNGVYSLGDNKNIELYGTLVHDFGCFLGHKRPDGSGFYTQNTFGKKIIEHCLFYRSGGLNMGLHTYAGNEIGFDIIGNIFALAGGATDKTKVNHDNIYVNSGTPSDRIKIVGNLIYQPVATKGWRPNVRMSNKNKPVGVGNRNGVFNDNYVAGADWGLSLGLWKNMQVIGNTIWAKKVLIEINSAPTASGIGQGKVKPTLANYTLERNTYFLPKSPNAFRYSDLEDVKKSGLLSFKEWQALGLDRSSRVIVGKNGKPSGTRTFVFPNKYQQNRGHIGIFNWDAHTSVEMDLSSILRKGVTYTVYNYLDIRQTITSTKPVLSGKYDGAMIQIPMRKDPSSPDFEAFLIIGK